MLEQLGAGAFIARCIFKDAQRLGRSGIDTEGISRINESVLARARRGQLEHQLNSHRLIARIGLVALNPLKEHACEAMTELKIVRSDHDRLLGGMDREPIIVKLMERALLELKIKRELSRRIALRGRLALKELDRGGQVASPQIFGARRIERLDMRRVELRRRAIMLEGVVAPMKALFEELSEPIFELSEDGRIAIDACKMLALTF